MRLDLQHSAASSTSSDRVIIWPLTGRVMGPPPGAKRCMVIRAKEHGRFPSGRLQRCRLLSGALILPLVVSGQFWQEIQVPAPLDATTGALFGTSISLEDDLLLVGAPGNDDPGPNAGAAYLFQRNVDGLDQWGLLKRLEPPVLANNADFGSFVVLHEDLAFVSAPDDVVGGIISGAVHVFERDLGGVDNWGYKERVEPISLESGLRFGIAMDLEESLLVVGYDEPDDQSSLEDRGGIMTFTIGQSGFAEPIARFRYTYDPRSVHAHQGRFYYSKPLGAGFLPIDSVDAVPSDTTMLDAGQLLPSWKVLNPLAPPDTNVWWDTLDYLIKDPLVVRDGMVAGLRMEQVSFGFGNELAWSVIAVLDVEDPDTALLVGTRFREEEFAASANWGHDLALMTDGRLLVAAPGPLVGIPQGQVRVYTMPDTIGGSYALATALYQSDPSLGDRFGEVVDTHGGLVAVGAPNKGIDDRGAVYLFVDPSVGHRTLNARSTKVSVYPNPSSDGRFFVEWSERSGVHDWVVRDVLGRPIPHEMQLDGIPFIQLRTASSGIYYLSSPHTGHAAVQLIVAP